VWNYNVNLLEYYAHAFVIRLNIIYAGLRVYVFTFITVSSRKRNIQRGLWNEDVADLPVYSDGRDGIEGSRSEENGKPEVPAAAEETGRPVPRDDAQQ